MPHFAHFFDINRFELLDIEYHPQKAMQLFAPISHQVGSVLLQSATSDHPDGRYDILATQPQALIEFTQQQGQITTATQITHIQQDPFEFLNLALQSLPSSPSNAQTLPFTGGFIGLWGYDLGRQIESLPNQAKDDIDLADMAIGLYNWAVIVDHHLQKAYCVGVDAKQRYYELTQLSAPPSLPFALTRPWQSNMTKQSYEQKFNQVKDYIYAGDCYQINLAQRFSARYQGDLWQAYQKLATHNGGPFSAFMNFSNSTLLSVSPERFIKLDGTNMETKPIKGTRPRMVVPKQDALIKQELANAEKDQAENLMIVDLLRNDFGKVAQAGSVCVPKLFDIESFPAVHHLVSTVSAQLQPEYNAVDLLKACFPGGSITGTPKVRAMQIIEELEPHRRNAYCGSMGYVSINGKMDTSITIRTLIAHNQHLYAWAGGGLVADSLASAEYQETLDKLAKILPIL